MVGVGGVIGMKSEKDGYFLPSIVIEIEQRWDWTDLQQ